MTTHNNKSQSTRISLAITSFVATLYSVSTAVLLGLLEVAVVYPTFEPTPAHAGVVGILTYVTLFALPEARKWIKFASWEKAVIAFTPVIVLLYSFSPAIQDAVAASPPVAGALWALTMFTGAVMLR